MDDNHHSSIDTHTIHRDIQMNHILQRNSRDHHGQIEEVDHLPAKLKSANDKQPFSINSF